MSFGGGGSSAAPTPQQQALATEQATTNANLNLEENEQRKTILNALQGTRVFRGSALSRQIASNAPAAGPAPAPSDNQQNPVGKNVGVGTSLLDLQGNVVTPGSATSTTAAATAANAAIGRTVAAAVGRAGVAVGRA